MKASDWFDGLEEAIAAIAYHMKENDEYSLFIHVFVVENKK